MRRYSTYWTISLTLAAVALGGCAATSTPYLDSKFGDSVNQAKALQTLNPTAPGKRTTANGLDGQAADAVVDRYHKSYETPPPPVNVFNIGVGTGSNTSGTGSSTR